MRSVVPFDYKTLSPLAQVEHAVLESGRIALRKKDDASAFPYLPKGGMASVWSSDGGWILRTKGEPVTMRNVRAAFGELASEASERHHVDERIILVTIACESGPYPMAPTERNLRAPRTEPGYPDRAGDSDYGDEARDLIDWQKSKGMHSSHGVMQTLISTAWSCARELFRDASPEKYREVLWVPKNSIEAGTSFYGAFSKGVLADPVATRAKYGAGIVYPSAKNVFGVRLSAEASMTNWVAFWNDLAEVEGEDERV